MVDVMGHVAMAALWALPAWYLWDARPSLAFVGLVLATAMLPDVDLLLRDVLPGVHHHGVTHTVVFVVGVALVAGVLAARALMPAIERWWIRSGSQAVPRLDVYAFVTGGLLLGGLSHLFADMLSAPDISQPVEPFWPFFDKPVSVDLIYYSSPVWNLGLLTVAALLHAVVAYADIEPLAGSSGLLGR